MVGVFHKIGITDPYQFTNSIEQINGFSGEITFDGIYSTVWENRDKLEKKAILFISGDQIGKEGFCTKEQLLKLKEDGHVLAWHGHSHRRLTELSEEEIRQELTQPDWVEPIYAYPHGDFNELSKKILEEMGYIAGYSTTQGDGSTYAIKRIYI